MNNTGADPASLNVTTDNIACLRVRGIASQVGNNTNLTTTASWTAWANGNSATTGTTAEMCARAEHIISTATSAASDPTYVRRSMRVSIVRSMRWTSPLGGSGHESEAPGEAAVSARAALVDEGPQIVAAEVVIEYMPCSCTAWPVASALWRDTVWTQSTGPLLGIPPAASETEMPGRAEAFPVADPLPRDPQWRQSWAATAIPSVPPPSAASWPLTRRAAQSTDWLSRPSLGLVAKPPASQALANPAPKGQRDTFWTNVPQPQAEAVMPPKAAQLALPPKAAPILPSWLGRLPPQTEEVEPEPSTDMPGLATQWPVSDGAPRGTQLSWMSMVGVLEPSIQVRAPFVATKLTLQYDKRLHSFAFVQGAAYQPEPEGAPAADTPARSGDGMASWGCGPQGRTAVLGAERTSVGAHRSGPRALHGNEADAPV